MELSLVFIVFSVVCPLSHSLPILTTGADFTVNTSDVSPKDQDVSDIIKEENKGLPGVFTGADMRHKVFRSLTTCNPCVWKQSPDGNVPIPFVLSSVYGESERSTFDTVMKEFEMMTCIRFVNRTTEQDYLSIESGKGCWSYVGKYGGKQTVSLSMPSCITYGTIEHELMHSLGFYHEHTREDRDNYIDIIWNNIAPAYKSIFDFDDGNLQNFPYDYNSIMHYNRYMFSKVPGQPSMLPKPDSKISMGMSVGMDNLDVMKINSMYKCDLCRRKFVNISDTFIYNSTLSGSSCLYLIQTSSMILLQLNNLNIPSSPGCNGAYIKVYDGVSKSSPVLQDKTCGNTLVPPLVSSGKYMLIEIVNNQSSSPSSFSASYDTVVYGGTFLSSPGLVTSPGFPSFPPRNASVVYSIIAPKGYRVSLKFDFFWLNPNTCATDYLAITGVLPNTIQTLATYCGYFPMTEDVVSTGNVMVLNLHTGNAVGYNGFTAKYDFVTGK